MKHVPHLLVGAPWPDDRVSVSIIQWRHLTKVLRVKRGDKVTYTDGLGVLGSGVLGNQEIRRGEEATVERPTALKMAVAPPASKDRQRYVVEKLTEIGVAKLTWLETRHGKNRLASPNKVFSWVQAALEQSRGSWLPEVEAGLVPLGDIDGSYIVCDPRGTDVPVESQTIIIGPEGGFASDEIPAVAPRWSLGPTVLRVETAAVVAAARGAGY